MTLHECPSKFNKSDLTRRVEWGSQTDNSMVGFSQLALLNSAAYEKCLAVSEWFYFSNSNKVINLHYRLYDCVMLS